MRKIIYLPAISVVCLISIWIESYIRAAAVPDSVGILYTVLLVAVLSGLPIGFAGLEKNWNKALSIADIVIGSIPTLLFSVTAGAAIVMTTCIN